MPDSKQKIAMKYGSVSSYRREEGKNENVQMSISEDISTQKAQPVLFFSKYQNFVFFIYRMFGLTTVFTNMCDFLIASRMLFIIILRSNLDLERVCQMQQMLHLRRMTIRDVFFLHLSKCDLQRMHPKSREKCHVWSSYLNFIILWYRIAIKNTVECLHIHYKAALKRYTNKCE